MLLIIFIILFSDEISIFFFFFFFRESSVQNATGKSDPYEIMQMLRTLNDNFNFQNNGINGLNGSFGMSNCISEVNNGMQVNSMNMSMSGVNVMNIMDGISNLVV